MRALVAAATAAEAARTRAANLDMNAKARSESAWQVAIALKCGAATCSAKLMCAIVVGAETNRRTRRQKRSQREQSICERSR